MKAWIRRLGLGRDRPAGAAHEAVTLHYRLRFDPQGLAPGERERLRGLAAELAREPER
jgi:hypothetical protein